MVLLLGQRHCTLAQVPSEDKLGTEMTCGLGRAARSKWPISHLSCMVLGRGPQQGGPGAQKGSVHVHFEFWQGKMAGTVYKAHVVWDPIFHPGENLGGSVWMSLNQSKDQRGSRRPMPR